MPKKGTSVLNPHTDLIVKRLKNGASLALLKTELHGLGCVVSSEGIRKWIVKRKSGGNITTGLRGAGRPAKIKTSPDTKLPASTVSAGLAILPRDIFSTGLPPTPTPEFYDLGGFLRTLANHLRAAELVSQLGIPCSSQGEPDFQEYAMVLGNEKLNRLTDLDFILLGINEMRRLFPKMEMDTWWLIDAYYKATQIRKIMLGLTRSEGHAT